MNYKAIHNFFKTNAAIICRDPRIGTSIPGVKFEYLPIGGVLGDMIEPFQKLYFLLDKQATGKI